MLTRTTVEFLAKDRDLDLKDIVGYPLNILLETETRKDRKFLGTCISAEYIGVYQGYSHFTAEVRPWAWFLTLRRDCRIFQEMKTPDIIKKVFSDAGFSDFQLSLTGSYETRTYCVQYRESDFDFISRLMEEEGIYYFFDTNGSREKMVLTDSIGAHKTVPGGDTIEFHFREQDYRRRNDHIFEWTAAEAVTTGKVTLTDYDFERPSKDMKQTRSITKGTHTHNKYELYDYPGQYTVDAAGALYTRVDMEGEASDYQVWRGAGNMREMGVGCLFKLDKHPRAANNTDYLIKRAVHLLQIETEWEERVSIGPVRDRILDFGDDNKDIYRVVFDVMLKTEPFRAPKITPWPRIAGLQTAVVVGPSGEEIYTDKYGRIKVQFHWDRMGKKDQQSSCWVRTVMPWTGKNWGMIAIPRIGQEVVIQFEEGNPDRPICTGMLYNAETMPPYELPGNMTQTGVKSRSTKSGAASNFNEFVFEDKKDAEFVRLQSEKDYVEIIKNNATITVGMEKKGPGDYTQTIYHNRTETVKTGDNKFTVEQGKEDRSIAKDKNETIGANYTQSVAEKSKVMIGASSEVTIGADSSVTIGGDLNEATTGDHNESVSGNVAETYSGSLSTDVTGAIAIHSMQKITLTVGGSSITIDKAGVTIQGMKIDISSSGSAEMKAAFSLKINAGIVNIN